MEWQGREDMLGWPVTQNTALKMRVLYYCMAFHNLLADESVALVFETSSE
jgi:hypothetical protein